MKPASASLLLLSLLTAVILASGCTGLDPQALATSNSLIRQFLDEHPNAEIKVTHFTAEQAKNIIDQIRKDCDNPYIDEKEFYRVTVNDTETSFYAIAWIDWSNRTIECVFKIGTEGKVVEKPKYGNCTNHAYSKCYNSHIYWFDSCGNVQDKKEYCKQGCSETTCLGECKSNAEYRCYGDHVYWFDSCGNVQDKKEYCNYGCNEGFCKPSTGAETCEQAGGYCIWPQGYCGDGICSDSERQQICGEVCPNCPADTAANCPAGTCTRACGYACPQDCGVIPPSGSGGGGISEEAQSGCENRCTASNIKFAYFWTDKEVYSIGEIVRFYVKLVDNNGNPATPEKGNRVYFFAISPTTGAGPAGSSSTINYNYTSGYYEFTTPPIPTNIDSGTWIFFATAENNESFVSSENVYVKINPTASSASITVIPTQYEGCVNRCLLRFRLADFTAITPVIQTPKIAEASTGMVVAMEVTATNTVVTYQCREGYEIGKYFCKEGGMCCIPKPTPTEFCGSSTQGPCSSDSGCITGGCSGQVCQSVQEEPVASTCEYKDCYNAQKYGMVCKCFIESITPAATAAIIGESTVQGRCKWTKAETTQYCKDSDGGNNYHVKGTAYTSTQELSDHCNDAYSLTEKYCYGNEIKAETYQCPYGCKDGACLKEAACRPEGEFCGGIAAIQCCSGLTCQLDGAYPDAGGKCIKTQTCTDSTGIIHKFGESWIAPDGCNTCYCKENGYITCTNTACTTCTDSDGGKDYYVKGQVKINGNGPGGATNGNDLCMQASAGGASYVYVQSCPAGSGCKLYEHYCSGSEMRFSIEEFICPNGCSEGACLEEQKNCTDSDGGRYDYYTKGTITTHQGSFTDFCVSPTLLVENYCDYSYYAPYQGRADHYNCTYGCSEGACIQQAQSCTSYYDQVCPASCAAGSDADCCVNAGKYWLQTSWGYGCYDTNYNPGCSAQNACGSTSDQCCPNWCAAGSDIDCCTQAQKCWIDNGCYTCQ